MSEYPRSGAAQLTNVGSRPAASSEVYGGDLLPVLMSLPDMRTGEETQEPAQVGQEEIPGGARPEPEPAQPLVHAAAEPSCRGGTDQGPPVTPDTALSPRERRLRAQQQLREQRLAQRGPRRAPPAWVRSLGQIVFAAVVAGVLLAVIVSLRGRPTSPTGVLPNPAAPQTADIAPLVAPAAIPATGSPRMTIHADLPPGPQLGAPNMAELGPTLELVAPAGSGQTDTLEGDSAGQLPSALIRTARVLPEMTPYRADVPLDASRSARAPSTTHASPGAASSAQPYAYPTTGIEPVLGEPSRPQGVRPGWSEVLPGTPPRGTDRPSTPAGYPSGYGSGYR